MKAPDLSKGMVVLLTAFGLGPRVRSDEQLLAKIDAACEKVAKPVAGRRQAQQ